MSVLEVWNLWCDGCGRTDPDEVGADTPGEMRRARAEQGWQVDLPGGRDLCPTCREEAPDEQ